jgi:hypothetical protein
MNVGDKMPNRIIKESICTSKTIEQLSNAAEILFYRILVNCEDYGRMHAEPTLIKSKCYPWKENLKLTDIEKWIKELEEVNLIILYEHSENRYLQVTNWCKHQQVRATKSKYPSFDEEGCKLITLDINCNQNKSIVSESEQTRIRITNTNTNTKAIKTNYADNVTMTEEEYKKLIEKHGQAKTDKMIEVLDNYKGANGKKYTSDYKAILSWVVDKVKDAKVDKPESKAWGWE